MFIPASKQERIVPNLSPTQVMQVPKNMDDAFHDLEEITEKLKIDLTNAQFKKDYEAMNASNDFADGAAPLGVVRYKKKVKIAEDAFAKLIEGLSHEEIMSRCMHDLNFLSKFMLPDLHKYDYPPLLNTMWNLVITGVMDLQEFVGEARYVLGIPRGFTKTTLVKLMMCFAIFFTENTFILVVGSIVDNASNIVRDVREMLNQRHVIEVFGDWKSELDTNRKDLLVFRLMGKWVILKPMGERTSTRGINIGNLRPNFIIPEDMQTEENAKSVAESDGLLTWFSSTLIPACSPEGCVYLYIGNTYAYDGSIMSKLINNPSWVSLTLGAITPDGKSLWEELHPIKKLLHAYVEAKRNHKETHWLAQMMNATDIVHDVALDTDRIEEAYTKRWLNEDGIPYHRQLLVSFVIIDPSSQRVNADEIAIGHASMYTDGTFIVDDLMSSRMNPKQNIMTAIAMCTKHNTPIILVENVAYQETLRFWFDEVAKELGIDWLTTFGFVPGRLKKNTRIATSFEQLMDGDYLLTPEVMLEYFPQARKFKVALTTNQDDKLDVVALAYDQYNKLKDKILYQYSNLKAIMNYSKTTQRRSRSYDTV